MPFFKPYSKTSRRLVVLASLLLTAATANAEFDPADVRTTTRFSPPFIMGVAGDGLLFPGDLLIGSEVLEVRIAWDVVVADGHNAADIRADVNLPIHAHFGGGARIDLDGPTLGWSGSGTFHYYEATDRYNGFFGQEGTWWHWYSVGLPTDAVEVLPTSRIEIDYVTMYPPDLDGDGDVDLADLNSLTAEADLATGLAVPPAAPKFDLTGDDIVDGSDLDQWLADAATINGFDSPYLKGDTNLDGDVDIWAMDGTGDAQVLISNLGTTTGAVWGNADFNGDGDVDIWATGGSGDAQALTSNLGNFSPSSQTAFVPATMIVSEPSTIAMLGVLGLIGIGVFRNRRRVHHRSIATPNRG